MTAGIGFLLITQPFTPSGVAEEKSQVNHGSFETIPRPFTADGPGFTWIEPKDYFSRPAAAESIANATPEAYLRLTAITTIKKYRK